MEEARLSGDAEGFEDGELKDEESGAGKGMREGFAGESDSEAAS